MFFWHNRNMKKIDSNEILDRIKYLIKKDYRTQNELAEYLGKSRQFFYDWKKGVALSAEDLLNIANFFGVTMEYLISGEDASINDETAAFIVSTNGLTENQKESIFIALNAQVQYWREINGFNVDPDNKTE